MTKREELEAVLAGAEAALANAAINAAKVGADRAEANASLDVARAYCRRVRTTLLKLDCSGAMERTGIPIKQSGEVSKRGASASATSRQASEHAFRGEDKRSQDEARRPKPIHRFNIDSTAQKCSPGNALETPSLPRQAIGLLALILAYLLYFHIDVQLQISSLPLIFPLLHL